MKKIFLAAVLFMAVAPLAFSSGIIRSHTIVAPSPIDGVPAEVIESFNSRFPTATNVQWQIISSTATILYVADFYQGDEPARIKHLQATFAADGTFLGKQRV